MIRQYFVKIHLVTVHKCTSENLNIVLLFTIPIPIVFIYNIESLV